MNPIIELDEQYCAHSDQPLPVGLVHGEGVYLWDVDGKNYLDMLSAYGAASFGHAHPRLVRALSEQAGRLAIVSRAYYTDKLPTLLEKICLLTNQDKALPLTTVAEAVEAALTAAHKWAYKVKGVAEGLAKIIVCEGSFHGHPISMSGSSSSVPFGNAAALEEAITPNTAAFLVEPIQGERGIIVPPDGYLAACAQICQKHNVLLICDETQTGLGRTGKLLACEHEDVQPDGLILGAALGGGLVPMSLFLAREDVMNVITLDDHASTFGGNPLAAAVAFEVINVLGAERLPEQAAKHGRDFLKKLKTLNSPLIKEVRGRGLFIGMEIDPDKASARAVCEELARNGILTKDAHETVVRFTPPLNITQEELDWAFDTVRNVLAQMQAVSSAA